MRVDDHRMVRQPEERGCSTNLLQDESQKLGAQVVERPRGLVILILSRGVGQLAGARGERRHSLSPLDGAFDQIHGQLTDDWRHG